MSGLTYRAVFEQAFHSSRPAKPYSYQCRLACGPDANPDDDRTLLTGAACQSQLIEVPTGLGKTAAVVLAWVWNRLLQPDRAARKSWPRRLVYCLPMRTLVEQTRDSINSWLENLHLPSAIGVHVLMGGEAREDWDIYPEREAILIGTQDMLLSRALNRGYGMSRYRWPMHFGLLNNDALWVLDETQLMGVTVETSAQLDGFRSNPCWPAASVCPTWWMSATLDRSRLATVDHPQPQAGWLTLTLSDAERASGGIQRRFNAKKLLAKSESALSAATKKSYGKDVARFIRQKHRPGTFTLVVVNRVTRAQEIYVALGDKKLGLDPARIAIIHSRFRPVDRERHSKLLFGEGDRIVIATQAVEAGVDVSADLLITELAPWSSLVQRFGRCNRAGEQNNHAEIVWIDVQPKDDKDDLALPYSAAELKVAHAEIEKLSEAGPQFLAHVKVQPPKVVRPVLRRRDLIDFFDTTPDLCGQDLDVSRYIRDGEDSDVQFYWRLISTERPPENEPEPVRGELCRISLGEAAKFFKKEKSRAWRWNPLAETWEEAKHPRPGAVYLVDAKAAGYSDQLGWTGDPKDQISVHPPEADTRDAYRKDPETFIRYWLDLARHTADVVEETKSLAAALTLDEALSTVFLAAAQWHDIGKAHEAFQAMLRGTEDGRQEVLWAKSGLADAKCSRPGFRHELASALAWLLHGPADTVDRDLVGYLIAAHHGKVRLSIRALPDEKGPIGNGDQPFARGVWQDDELLPVTLPGVPAARLRLDLGFMKMGDGEHGPSWLARMIALRDRLGPFRLAYLETLLRAADMRASAAEAAKAAVQAATIQ